MGKVDRVTQYMAGPDGTRIAGFSVDGMKVTVCPSEPDGNGRAMAVAAMLAGGTDALAVARAEVGDAMAALRDEAATLRTQLAVAQSRIPPAKRHRVMNTGYVRFDRDGSIWLLGSREKGWSSFGFRFGSWDELFRCWDVVVTGHGTDEHGNWWSVENSAGEVA